MTGTLPVWASGLIGAGIFFILMFLKMHVGMSLMTAGFVGFWLTAGWDGALSGLAGAIFNTSMNEVLVIIPLFIVMGTIAAAGGPMDSAFYTWSKWIGHWRGGLAMAAVGSCAAFGAVCGDNIATSMVMDRAALPQMRKYGYKDTLSFGAIGAGGGLGLLIPPSAAFVVFGFITEQDIAGLFIAGILPGLLLATMMIIQIFIQTRINPSLAPRSEVATWSERFKSLIGMVPILLGFFVVMVGLILSWFTPQEAGAMGTLVMSAVCVPYLFLNTKFKKLTWKTYANAFMEAVKIGSMILLLIFGAKYFSNFLTSSTVAKSISEAVIDAGMSKYAVMFMVALVFLILGCLMDVWSVMIITLPIFFNPLVELGFNPYQLGAITVLCIVIGTITPPVGVVVFTLAGVHREVPMYSIFKGVLPFVLTLVLCMIILVFVPEIASWLPEHFLGPANVG